jgi:probable HAF family extracellular repeat protein
MFRVSTLIAVAAALLTVPTLRAAGPSGIDPASYTYEFIDAPFGGPGTTTNLLGLNDHGQIVGFWFDPAVPGSDVHPFLYDHGDFLDLDPQRDGVRDTRPLGINNKGQVVGTYRINEAVFSFLFEDGVFTTLPLPHGARAMSINDRGEIAGFLVGPSDVQGFLYARGVLTLIDVPDVDADVTAVDVNSRGQVVGYFRNPSKATNTYRGFLFDDGRLTTLDVSFSTPPDTRPVGINNRGQVVGSSFQWVSGRPVFLHGFFYDRGRFFRFDVGGRQTTLTRINERGQIIGSFSDGTRLVNFLASPSSN